MPTMEALAEENKDKMRLIKIDATGNRRLCMGLRLMSLPAFLFYRDGKEVGRLSGNDLGEEDLRKAISSLLAGEEITK
jgi:thioredoxin 1